VAEKHENRRNCTIHTGGALRGTDKCEIKNNRTNAVFKPIQQPLLSLCVKLYEESVTCQGQFERFRKILVTSRAVAG
jgi:hypothetical protein